jgi:hypothetical protein
VKAAPHHVHTAGNAVPNVDATELGNVLDDLTGIHAGIDLIRDGIRHLAHDRHTPDTTQTLLATLAGSSDGTDVIAAIGLLVARLTHTDSNPALRTLPLDRQKNAQREGEQALFALTDPYIHQPTAEACAHIDQF